MTVLKNIAKQPAKYVTDATVKRAFYSNRYQRLIESSKTDIVQVLVDYITEAGRFTDDILPSSLFQGKRSVCLKNSKISGYDI